NGQLVARTAWVNRLPPPGMAGATGVPLAVALKLALSGRLARPGVLTPEEAFDPDVFFEEFAQRCTPELGPLLHVSGHQAVRP
ncbi:MAG TPA: saccharopine dehydrogenase C-terminal domain-containing protein, partial [Micropepsaceae bacterium]|nr:saccharopine dehydrogenase C-terminal domain-containing protein [Micropepsaceae bacterium]